MSTTNGAHSASGRTVYLETFGCQMNELDSELVRGQLSALGYRFTDDFKSADVVLYNTCSVREQAENKAFSRVGIVGRHKKRGREVILGVIGCMAERDGADMMTRYPQIDLLCGPGELDKLPILLDNATKTDAVDRADRIALQGSNHRRSSTLGAAEDDLELLDLSRSFDPERATSGGRSAYVRITRGCNKFCTYCVVPNTRGAEVHRPPDHIVDECRRLAERGVIEVTLLGQTVNHYVYVHGTALTLDGREAPQVGPGLKFFKERAASAGAASNGGRRASSGGAPPTLTPGPSPMGRGETIARGATRTTTFADLLKRIHDEVPAIRRLRFVTSYPRDFGDDVLQVIAESPRICRYLHVPAQSGSNAVLQRMNRGYTVEAYLEFVDRARAFLPDVTIAGDIIVGFPGETEEDFEATKHLLHRVRFKNNFIFKYSPRPGTVAIKRFEDDVPDNVKRRRNNELLALQAEIGAEVHAEQVGRRVEIMVEGVSQLSAKRRANVELRWESPAVQMTGRTMGDMIVAFDCPAGRDPDELVGKIIPVDITDSGPLILYGAATRGE